jgi:hypothetical protein
VAKQVDAARRLQRGDRVEYPGYQRVWGARASQVGESHPALRDRQRLKVLEVFVAESR